ncbi:MAG: lipopolysaccharide biosynthesis protein, partial [Muribaculaceae bacterium]|nr:lipopolysaccharide biosynthesis protein [Muribaculaceae bacterium]
MSNLKEKTAQGIFWSAINNGVIQLLNIFIGIFLARILSPADYGIVGVLTIFTLLAGNIQSSGFTQALINLAKPSRNDYNSVFWFNVLASVVIYFILFACAPLIASFFHQPCLTSLSRFVFLSFVVAAFGIVPNGYMVKNMMNREIAIVNFVAMIVSGAVGITLAIKQMAYWSLAWQQLTYITVLNLGRYHYVGWRPSLKIDFTPVRRMFPFSVKILITTIITTISTNVLTFIFGRIFPMKDVGNYTQANKWSSMASTFVSGTLAQIAQIVLVESSSEREREKRVFRKITRFTAFLAFPALFGLALISNEFILSTITQKWIDAVPLMQILCIGAAFLPFHTLFQNLAISNHRSDIFMWCSLLQIATQIITIAVLHEHGIVTMVF